MYASSKDALRRSLVGVAAEFQGTDLSEIALESGTSGFIYLSPPLFTQHTYAVLEKVSRAA
jgi:Cofilin/tropomyosin-type actin-binding protein